MRKKSRRRIAAPSSARPLAPQSTPRSPGKPVLKLSQETVRTLRSEELSQAASGCPTGSSPTTFDREPSGGCFQ